LGLMKETQEWRETYFTKGAIDAQALQQDLALGIMYFVGRDKELRPTLVCRANRIPTAWFKDKQVDRLIKLVIFCMEYMQRYMCIPGKIESQNLIVDLKGLSASQVPISELQKIYNITSNHYSGRVFRFYVINMSTWLGILSSAVKALLTDRQKQKLCMLNKVEEFREDYALHQLEEDHGGTRPILTSFFPFPLAQGPFEAGYSQGPRNDSVPRVDTILSSLNCRGRLWDARKTREANTVMDYTVEGIDVFKKCNLPVPEQLLEKERKKTLKKEELEQATRTNSVKSLNVDSVGSGPFLPQGGMPIAGKVADTPTSCLPDSPSIPLAAAEMRNANDERPSSMMPGMVSLKEDEEGDDELEMIYQDSKIEPELTSVEVTPIDWFSCRCCSVSR